MNNFKQELEEILYRVIYDSIGELEDKNWIGKFADQISTLVLKYAEEAVGGMEGKRLNFKNGNYIMTNGEMRNNLRKQIKQNLKEVFSEKPN